ncbi:flagellar protein FlaG [Lysinibacillus sphaericus]|uniref:Flagellar protein FlaG n=1 Tax=Lysinibacillus sphaericus OT4b.31 TaxID=1285586 RepID=R7ZHA1_LYSSH|nr:flagellar protein FlaG [Lysinibacillus sphaericus]EON73419.1 flagellar protein FlaG [Lysinibacillus sphaericus OT4b.31]
MRIEAQGQSMDAITAKKNKNVVSGQDSIKIKATSEPVSQPVVEKETIVGEEKEISKEKLQQAVQAVNDFLEINHSSSKFKYHEGLERYYVTIVNRDTEEVVKEIPPKKLLDAFYEMQKLLGMIVDEKI